MQVFNAGHMNSLMHPFLTLQDPAISSFNAIYTSSVTAEDLPWNTYNYCNAPHVNSRHYHTPSVCGAKLVYLSGMMRHHKRTPDNLYPNEGQLDSGIVWDCSDLIAHSYAGGTAHVYHETMPSSSHPFHQNFWVGTCDMGQLTKEGLQDSIQHGKDFWSVYHDKLDFLSAVSEDEIYIRTSTEVRTHQVAGGLLFGMDPSSASRLWPVHTQPRVIDSLVPHYACPSASAIRRAHESAHIWTDHLVQHSDLKARLDSTLGTASQPGWSSWYDHYFDTFTARTCHGHPLPCNSVGECISQDDADQVFALGHWEYNYLWNAAENAVLYTKLTFGVMFAELAENFRQFRSGNEKYKARLYIGHDGSMIRLAAGLGLGKRVPLHWPAMGSEIMMEVWQTPQKELFVRVMHEGTPVEGFHWLPFDQFVSLLEDQVPDRIFERCMDLDRVL